MNVASRVLSSLAVAGVIVLTTSAATAQQAGDAKAPEFKLPPGWTLQDMQACLLAATPGKMHEKLLADVGAWEGSQKLWMAPDTEPVTSKVTSTCASLLDGRFLKIEVKGEIPGMGPYHGLGLYGYDNVTQQFVATWIDNHSTAIMNGTGQASADGRTLTTTYTYTCPLTKKPTTMREVETETGPGMKTLEMFGTDPKSGKEYKMMVLELQKK